MLTSREIRSTVRGISSLFLTNACDLHLFLNKRFNLVRKNLLEMPGKIEYKSFKKIIKLNEELFHVHG